MHSHPLVLDAEAVDQLLPQIDVLQKMRQLFIELGRKQAVQPVQTLTLLPEDKGDFITYLGAASGAGTFGAKLSPYLIQENGPIITAWTILMSMQSGKPLMLCASGRLTTERTAATTALAVDLLADKAAQRVAIIGSGAMAQAHWRHIQTLRDWQEVCIYSPNLAANQKLQTEWQELCPAITFAASAEAAALNSDVVMLCASSGTPVLDEEAIAPNALVTSISTNVALAHEITPSFLPAAQVYCDYRETTPSTAGEMLIAARDHGWNAQQVKGDLAELATGSCELPGVDKPVFFRSVGLGLEDIAIANAIYRAARA